MGKRKQKEEKRKIEKKIGKKNNPTGDEEKHGRLGRIQKGLDERQWTKEKIRAREEIRGRQSRARVCP